MLLLWPAFLVIAVLIKRDSPGPVLFTQVRIGRDMRPFVIYKFRTMVMEADAGRPLTVGCDQRITRLGRFLRECKLDELPQLFNILKGDMSVVGPRPEVPRYVDLFGTQYARILRVRPGLTDLASLKFVDEAALLGRADDPEHEYRTTILPEKISLALLYARQSSLLLDLAIIAQTVLRLCRVPLAVCEVPDAGSSGVRRFSPYRTLKGLVVRWRRPVIVSLDVGLIVLSNYLAFWLRFDGDIPPSVTAQFLSSLPWLLVFRGTAFSFFRLHEGL
jgi:lipopolysaccharide/colanic/teichoic acid biosynthesis glycosyltransferase